MDELSDWQGQMKSSNLISLDEYTEAGSEVKMESVGNSFEGARRCSGERRT